MTKRITIQMPDDVYEDLKKSFSEQHIMEHFEFNRVVENKITALLISTLTASVYEREREAIAAKVANRFQRVKVVVLESQNNYQPTVVQDSATVWQIIKRRLFTMIKSVKIRLTFIITLCALLVFPSFTSAATMQTFTDVPPSYPFYNEIEDLAARGIMLGTGGGLFEPEIAAPRWASAVVIERALGNFNPQNNGNFFDDVPSNQFYYPFVNQFYADGITSGCGFRLFCPDAATTREQIAVFIVRALGEFNPPTPATQRFTDVPPTHPFYNFIDRLAALGITDGCGVDTYCPSLVLTRGALAKMVSRAFPAGNKKSKFTKAFYSGNARVDVAQNFVKPVHYKAASAAKTLAKTLAQQCRTRDYYTETKMYQVINSHYYLLQTLAPSTYSGASSPRSFTGTACGGDGIYISTNRSCPVNVEVVDGGLISDTMAYLLLYCPDPSNSMRFPLDIDFTAAGNPVYDILDRRWWGYTDFVNGRECFPVNVSWAC